MNIRRKIRIYSLNGSFYVDNCLSLYMWTMCSKYGDGLYTWTICWTNYLIYRPEETKQRRALKERTIRVCVCVRRKYVETEKENTSQQLTRTVDAKLDCQVYC